MRAVSRDCRSETKNRHFITKIKFFTDINFFEKLNLEKIKTYSRGLGVACCHQKLKKVRVKKMEK